VRILIADDHALFRQAIAHILTADKGFEMVGEAANGTEAVELATTLHPDVVLMDIGMPGLSSFDATRQIKTARPATKVLFLSMYDERDFVREAMQSGASGYLLKDTPAAELISALRKIAGGGTHLTPRMLSQLMEDVRSVRPADPGTSRIETLTPRERQVLKLSAEGRSAKEIASELNLSVKTVESHKSSMMRKLDLHNSSQVVQFAIRNKVISIGRNTHS
jgi:two-component system response regulator NreC